MINVPIDPTFSLKKKKAVNNNQAYLEYRRRWQENPQNDIVDKFPIHLDLETVTRCNLRCFMCHQSYGSPESQVMEMALFKKSIDEGSREGVCSIKLQYRGEPLLDNRIPEMVKYAKERGIIEVMFNTNVTLLNKEKAKSLIEAGLDKIICSIDGCTKEVYEKVRIGANFEVVLNNIKYLQQLKQIMGVSKPILRVQMVDTPKNHDQIEEYLKFWEAIVDEVSVEVMQDWGIKEEDDTPLLDFACAQLWQRLIVLADGDVLFCCMAMRAGNEEVLGNANHVGLSKLWQSDKLNTFRELHRKGQSHKMKLCRLCGLRKWLINQKQK